MKTPSRLVDFNPDAAATNQQIKYLNDLHINGDDQKIATLMASSVAAIAFMMLETNTKVKVKQLFDSIVNEAHDKRERRNAAIAGIKRNG